MQLYHISLSQAIEPLVQPLCGLLIPMLLAVSAAKQSHVCLHWCFLFYSVTLISTVLQKKLKRNINHIFFWQFCTMVGWLVGWSLTSLFSTNLAISKTRILQEICPAVWVTAADKPVHKYPYEIRELFIGYVIIIFYSCFRKRMTSYKFLSTIMQRC